MRIGTVIIFRIPVLVKVQTRPVASPGRKNGMACKTTVSCMGRPFLVVSDHLGLVDDRGPATLVFEDTNLDLDYAPEDGTSVCIKVEGEREVE